MGKNGSSRHISEVGNYGDGREYYASKYVLENSKPKNPDEVLVALENFDVRWTMLHLGREKGEYLDAALRELISERRRSERSSLTRSAHFRPKPIRVLEIGSYIGYSAIRMGRILAMEAERGSTLLSVEQNHDNAGYAKTHVEHAGLNEIVEVKHSKVENCFEEEIIEDQIRNDDSQLDRNRPYDFVFFDHRKSFYLRDLKLLESRGVINATITTVVADNVASLEHIKNREESIARGKRKGPCKCVKKACDYLDFVRRRWSSTEIYYGNNTKDGISVSKPSSRSETRSA